MAETEETKTVLIIEDDNDAYFAIATAMRQAGLGAIGASSEKLANRALGLAPPDALVVDLTLAGHSSGKGVIQSLRSSIDFKDVPIIVHTGTPLSRHEMDELQHTVSAIVFKGPNSIVRVVQAVEHVLGKRE